MQRFCINDSINILRNIDDVQRNISQFNMDVESGVGGAEGHVHISGASAASGLLGKPGTYHGLLGVWI